MQLTARRMEEPPTASDALVVNKAPADWVETTVLVESLKDLFEATVLLESLRNEDRSPIGDSVSNPSGSALLPVEFTLCAA